MHQQNRMLPILAILMTCYWDRRGQTGTDWDACFWTFSHILRIGDRKNPRILPFLGHILGLMKENAVRVDKNVTSGFEKQRE